MVVGFFGTKNNVRLMGFLSGLEWPDSGKPYWQKVRALETNRGKRSLITEIRVGFSDENTTVAVVAGEKQQKFNCPVFRLQDADGIARDIVVIIDGKTDRKDEVRKLLQAKRRGQVLILRRDNVEMQDEKG